MRYVLLFCFCVVTSMLHAQDIFDEYINVGAENTTSYLPKLNGKRVGLVINQTSRVGNDMLLDFLITHGINIVKIFAPEHGIRGLADAGATVETGRDSTTGIDVISLYGKNYKPKPEQISDIDILVFDIQDVGVRFYTYISTLEYCMEACAENHKSFMVLDRPNPNGFYLAGPVLDKRFQSFVGRQCIPVVYGMTLGEYAKMLVGENLFKNGNELDLIVIPCKNYDHTKKYRLPVPPSPNLRTMTAVYAYPSLCLFEGTVISVGRGTQLPFQQFGCPEFKGKYLYSFKPEVATGSKSPLYENKECFGMVVAENETEIQKKTNKNINIGWLIEAYKNYPDKEHFFNNFFDKLAGNSNLKEQISAGEPAEQILRSWKDEINSFKNVRKRYLLYKDFE